MKKLTDLPEWIALTEHTKKIEPQKMQTWFAEDPKRFDKFSLQVGDIFLDYSKNRHTTETINLLCKLADATHLTEKINDLFSGKKINSTEKRAALHTALRDKKINNLPEIHTAFEKMAAFVEQVRNQIWRGVTGKPIQTIVNIGIGGSHLGPLMTTHALSDFSTDTLHCYFIANIDDADVQLVLKQLNPETTLFIVSSKSFSTLETLTSAHTIKTWFQEKLHTKNITQHFVAVTAEPEKAIAFGIAAENIFPVWEWVGGRYSIWSTIGLPLALMIGIKHFSDFLEGAYVMDQHFHHADFSHNMPVIMALLGIWYRNFLGAETHAIVPYSHHLNYLRVYLQQLDMESNGKRITHSGEIIDYATGPIIWGGQGSHGQHAFHQLLHQGQHLTPIDFILVGKSNDQTNQLHHDILVGSGLSQAQALLQGKSVEQAHKELISAGYTSADANHLAPHKAIPGNRPSNTLFLTKMTPFALGSLLALYEHKVFVQGAIWNINSFDQWGVELGKELLPIILADFNNTEEQATHDASTRGLIRHYKNMQRHS